MNNSPRHVALVLGAGGSRRLGRPKQLLTRNGETLVHRACRLAVETFPQRVLLVAGAGEADVLAAVADLPLEAIHNASWERGLASSLAVASKNLPNDGTPLLILGSDQPALASSHLQALLKSAQVIGERGGRGHAAIRYADAVGMPAVVPASLLHGADASGDIGLRRVLNRLDSEDLAIVDAPGLALDIDTPEDLRAAREQGLIDPD